MSGLGGIDRGAMQQTIVEMVEGRLAGLVGKSSGYIESLPIPTKLRIQALNGLQSKHEENVKQYKLECLALEKKYAELHKPLHSRLYELVNGTGPAPSKEEITKGEAQSKKDAEPEEYEPLPVDTAEAKDDGKGIQEFWLQVFKNHLTLGDLLSDRDGPAIASLKDVKVEYLEDKLGYKLSFHFGPNEWFEQEVLEKTYLYQEEVGYSGEFLYDKAIGTEIKWKAGKNLTVETVTKSQRNKATNQTRTVTKTIPTTSFFSFFDPPSAPSDDDDNEDEDEEVDEDLPEKLAMDYQLGEDFKDSIIPKATDYFTGKALQWDILNTEIDSDDEEDWEEAEDDDEDEDEDDD